MGIRSRLDRTMLRIQTDTQYFLVAPDSSLFCQQCKERLGFWRSVRMARRVKKGQTYHVICKDCGHSNPIVRGEIGKYLDKRWKDLDEQEEKLS